MKTHLPDQRRPRTLLRKCVAPTSKSAIARVSKPAGSREAGALGRLGNRRYSRLGNLRYRRLTHPLRLDDRICQRKAFTLIELMVVVIVIGILAAMIIPQFIGTTYDAKVSAAKAHIAELGNAIARFNIHMDRYPTTEEGLKVLVERPTGDDEKKWRGPYVQQLRNDPWGTPYEYRCPGVHHPSSFDLWSKGADKADGGEGEGADIGNW